MRRWVRVWGSVMERNDGEVVVGGRVSSMVGRRIVSMRDGGGVCEVDWGGFVFVKWWGVLRGLHRVAAGQPQR